MTHADEFPIVIRRTKNGFVAEAAALGLERSGQDVTALEAEMRSAVDDILAVCDRHGARIDSSSQKVNVERSEVSPYRRSIIGAMAAVLVVAVVSLPMLLVYQKMSSLLASAQHFNPAIFARLLSSGVEKTADTLEMITPERRNQLTKDFGRIAHAVEPYAAQFRPLWALPPTPVSQSLTGERK